MAVLSARGTRISRYAYLIQHDSLRIVKPALPCQVPLQLVAPRFSAIRSFDNEIIQSYMGGGQEHEPRREHEPEGYYRAARFAGERPAGRVYERLQEAIYHAACDLSAYRFQLNHIYHVAVLGEPPPEDVERRVTRLLAQGEAVTLPREVLTALAARRRQATQLGPWVEGHHQPGERL